MSTDEHIYKHPVMRLLHRKTDVYSHLFSLPLRPDDIAYLVPKGSVVPWTAHNNQTEVRGRGVGTEIERLKRTLQSYAKNGNKRCKCVTCQNCTSYTKALQALKTYERYHNARQRVILANTSANRANQCATTYLREFSQTMPIYVVTVDTPGSLGLRISTDAQILMVKEGSRLQHDVGCGDRMLALNGVATSTIASESLPAHLSVRPLTLLMARCKEPPPMS